MTYNAEYHRKWTVQNRDKRRIANKRWRHNQAIWYKSLKLGRVCTKCGFDNPMALVWDHINGNKLIDPANMVNRGWGREKILAELAKCELICSNCHLIKHAGE